MPWFSLYTGILLPTNRCASSALNANPLDATSFLLPPNIWSACPNKSAIPIFTHGLKEVLPELETLDSISDLEPEIVSIRAHLSTIWKGACCKRVMLPLNDILAKLNIYLWNNWLTSLSMARNKYSVFLPNTVIFLLSIEEHHILPGAREGLDE